MAFSAGDFSAQSVPSQPPSPCTFSLLPPACTDHRNASCYSPKASCVHEVLRSSTWIPLSDFTNPNISQTAVSLPAGACPVHAIFLPACMPSSGGICGVDAFVSSCTCRSSRGALHHCTRGGRGWRASCRNCVHKREASRLAIPQRPTNRTLQAASAAHVHAGRLACMPTYGGVDGAATETALAAATCMAAGR